MNIVICLPGKTFHSDTLRSIIELNYWGMEKRVDLSYAFAYNPNIYYVRNMCLGGDVKKGARQIPYDGKIKYDYMLWVDSDISFKPQHVEKLISSNKDITSGLYRMSDTINFATVEKWDTEFFKENGYFKFMTMDDIKDKTELIEVDYTGFGFMLVKAGVFESLDYPWFRPIEHKTGDMVEFASEDVSWCNIIKEKGYKIYVDPIVVVNHIKDIKL